MAENGDEEPLVELKGTGELLRELPHAFQQLIDDGGRLSRVPHQVLASVREVRTVTSPNLRRARNES